MIATRNATILDSALTYAERGLYVVPLRGKVPITKAGYKDATLDPGIIKLWWGKDYQGANIGIAVGEPYKLLCLDADCHKVEENGIESLEYLQQVHGLLPETMQVMSGGGGLHYYFTYPKGADIRNQKIAGYPGLEIKSNGGMVVPPSVHVSGIAYEWIEEQLPAASLPEWLRILIETPKKGSGHAGIDFALSERDERMLYSYAAEIALLDAQELARLKLGIRKVFGPSFPMREFTELVRAEKLAIEEHSRLKNMPVPKSAHELMRKEFHPVNWIIKDILPEGLVVLAGKQKIGKSWLDLDISLAVSSGGIALGSIPVVKGEVLYLALEDNERRLQDRIGQLLTPGQEAPNGFYYYETWPRMDAYGIAALEQFIQMHPALRLIIIDPWVKVKPQIKQRAGNTGYDAEYEALEGVKRLADTYHLCIIVQHHLRKASAEDPLDEINATTGLSACADGILILKRGRGEADAVLWGTGRDFKEEVNQALSFQDGFWKVLGNATVHALSKERQAVLDILSEAGKPMMPKEIATLLGKTDGATRKLLFDMKKRGEVKDVDHGYIPLISPSDCSNSGNAE